MLVNPNFNILTFTIFIFPKIALEGLRPQGTDFLSLACEVSGVNST